ncbi:DNA topoisomerase IV subunit B, partial [Acinetobacter baumannii]|nr:DNA topoisomerase IV subunit B [Acinetobacter baumannii]
SAFLLKGIKISLKDERDGQEDTFHYEEGIKEFISYLNEDKDTLTPVIYFSGEKEGIEAEFSCQYNDGYSENTLSFVNNVRTRDGGTHEVGMRTALTKSFNEYARKVGLLKEKDKNLEGSDFREGLSAIIS